MNSGRAPTRAKVLRPMIQAIQAGGAASGVGPAALVDCAGSGALVTVAAPAPGPPLRTDSGTAVGDGISGAIAGGSSAGGACGAGGAAFSGARAAVDAASATTTGGAIFLKSGDLI